MSCRKYIGFIPWVDLVSEEIAPSACVDLRAVSAPCCLNLSCVSRYTPRYLAAGEGSTSISPKLSGELSLRGAYRLKTTYCVFSPSNMAPLSFAQACASSSLLCSKSQEPLASVAQVRMAMSSMYLITSVSGCSCSSRSAL